MKSPIRGNEDQTWQRAWVYGLLQGLLEGVCHEIYPAFRQAGVSVGGGGGT